MKKALSILLLPLLLLTSNHRSAAQQKFENTLELDKTTHDFGDIMISDGPVNCEFNVKNVSNQPVAIYNVISSCGCTNVEWTREPIAAGKTGKIKATYSNDEGGYPFDKTLTAYVAGVKQPIILKLRGISHEKKLPLSELYPIRFGDLGLKEVEIKAGNMQQGQQKSGEFQVANLGKSQLSLSFSNISEGLSVSVSPNPIPAGSIAKVSYTVNSSRKLWGKNFYYATPQINGKSQNAVITSPEQTAKKPAGTEAIQSDPNPRLGAGKPQIGIWAITKEDFSSWTKEQKNKGSNLSFENSTYSFGKVKAGTTIEAEFKLTNTGKSELIIYKVDSDSSRATTTIASKLAPSAKTTVKTSINTSGMQKGEVLILLTLTTNSPLRPLVNLYITGFID